jgi:predicted metal-binding protein
MDHKRLEAIFSKYEMTDFKWIDPKEIVTAEWVRVKCMFGCWNYGKRSCCPPNTPSVSECRQFFNEYVQGVIFHFAKAVDKPDDRHAWAREINQRLLSVEREIFLIDYPKAFVLLIASCNICEECTGVREDCKNPKLARPAPDAMAVDVYTTARKFGFPIHVLNDYGQTMNRYAFLLVE